MAHTSEVALFVPCTLWTINRERKIHHHTRADLVKPIVRAAELIALNAIRQRQVVPLEVPCHVEFFPYQKPGVLADTANHLPPCKAVLDGLVKAGLIPEDNPQWVMSQRFWPPVKAKQTGIGVLLVPHPLDSASPGLTAHKNASEGSEE